MRVKIYQINPERDSNRMKFMSLSDSQPPDPSIYDEVFDAEIDENELEEIYGRFNTVGHPLFRGHSLSVSDVVVSYFGLYTQFEEEGGADILRRLYLCCRL